MLKRLRLHTLLGIATGADDDTDEVECSTRACVVRERHFDDYHPLVARSCRTKNSYWYVRVWAGVDGGAGLAWKSCIDRRPYKVRKWGVALRKQRTNVSKLGCNYLANELFALDHQVSALSLGGLCVDVLKN